MSELADGIQQAGSPPAKLWERIRQDPLRAPEHVALADQYQEAVMNRFPRGVVIKVEVRNQKGDSVLAIKGIPVEQVGMLVDALMDELPPVPQMIPRCTSSAAGGARGDRVIVPGSMNGGTALLGCRGAVLCTTTCLECV